MTKLFKTRNIHASHPIMRKGGVHQYSKSRKPFKQRIELNSEVEAYFMRTISPINLYPF
jgi:hypothetical protein